MKIVRPATTLLSTCLLALPVSAAVAATGDGRRDAAERLTLRLASPTGLEGLLAAAQEAASLLGEDEAARAVQQLATRALEQAARDPEAAVSWLSAALERTATDLTFEPLDEAPLPRGFPPPTPVLSIELKRYPAYRMVSTEMSGRAFWSLFRHIQENEIAMTAPVETTLAQGPKGTEETGRDGVRGVRMAFLYESPEQRAQSVGSDVSVIDVEPALVASLGVRGRNSAAAVEAARRRVLDWIDRRDDLTVAGPARTMSYNSPMVPAARSYWELQVPVRRSPEERVERTIVDFSQPQEVARWSAIDDVVMGGVSQSRLESTGEGTAVFTGELSRERGGGFASVRTEPGAHAPPVLGDAREIRLRCRGDGRTYQLRLRTTAAFDGVTYRAEVPTEAGRWIERTFALDELEPVFRGRRVQAPPLVAADVQSLGLLVSDGPEGAFRLELASISAR